MSLYERFFVQPLEDERAEVELEDEQRHMRLSFAKAPYFRAFLDMLREEQSKQQPVPGPEQNMLYQIGVRDGIGVAVNAMESILTEIKESRNG